MRSTFRLGAAVLLALPLLVACDAATPEPTASPSAEATPAASATEAASPSPSLSPEAEPACTEVAPDASRIDDILLMVSNVNTEPLYVNGGYLAPTVNVVLAASSAYGPQNPEQATLTLTDFLEMGYSSPGQYDFALPVATLDAYRAGDYAEYFPPTVLVGRDINSRVVAFSFDCDGLVDTMLLVSDENLLL